MDFRPPDSISRCRWEANAGNSPHTKRIEFSDRMTILPDVAHAIGQTPMVRLNNLPKKHGVQCEIVAKCEYLNPGGSLKDRVSLRMVQDAEEKGVLKPGCALIEPTSGNTGIGLAMIAAVKGYPCTIVMPEKMSNEKAYAIGALGANLVRTSDAASALGPDGPMGTSCKIAKNIPNSVILDQYTNASNQLSHYDGTAEEIWAQCEGKVDYIVMGTGTGGTVSGVARKFREISPSTKIIAVDPEGSTMARFPPEIVAQEAGFFEVEGIGHNYTPLTMDNAIVDQWLKVSDKDSFNTARSLIKEEGMLCGGSSGSNVFAALSVARTLPSDKRVVVILPDGIRNYMTKFVSDHWMEARGFSEPPQPTAKNEWWWDLPVSRLSLAEHVALAPESTCGEAAKILRNGTSFAVVISGAKISGFAELKRTLSALLAGKVEAEDKIERALNRSFRNVSPGASLGLVSRILEMEDYVAVVDEKERLIGVVTHEDVYNFVAGN